MERGLEGDGGMEGKGERKTHVTTVRVSFLVYDSEAVIGSVTCFSGYQRNIRSFAYGRRVTELTPLLRMSKAHLIPVTDSAISPSALL